jgi:hypothetical protein
MTAAAAALDELLVAATTGSTGPPSTATHGPIVDDAWNRGHFVFSHRVAQATGLDFVKLASLELLRGNHGIDQVLARIPGHAEAQRLRRIRNLHSSLHAAEARETIESLRDPALDPAAQRERWLDAVVESFELRTQSDSVATRGGYPQAAACADATGLSFEKLGRIQVLGGTDGLRTAVGLIPDLPERERCLAAL